MTIVIAGATTPAVAQSDLNDILSGVLDVMDKAAAPLNSGDDIDDSMLASVAESMSVSGTLDYLYEVYNTPTKSSYTHYRTQNYGGMRYNSRHQNNNGTSGGQRNYAYLIPSTAVSPVVGRVTSRYGYRPQFGRMHHGTDIAVNIGDTIRAAIDGVVLRVSNDAHGYGVFVCLQHNGGLETRYAHLSGVLVAPGMRVSAGDPIALGGNTGNSTGPHLHFETRVDGKAVDLSYMFNFSQPVSTYPKAKSSAYSYDAADIGIIAGTGSTAVSGTKSVSARSTYVVKVGDTIETIARKNGLSVIKLCNLNMLTLTDQLLPGRMLKLR